MTALLTAKDEENLHPTRLDAHPDDAAFNHPVSRRITHPGNQLGRHDLQSAYTLRNATKHNREWAVLARGAVRPLRMLFGSPILTLSIRHLCSGFYSLQQSRRYSSMSAVIMPLQQ